MEEVYLKLNNGLEVTIEKLKDLSLNSVPNTCNHEQNSSESMLTVRTKTNEETVLAGHVTTVMKSTVVIRRAPGSPILDSGTALYHRKNASEPVREVGLITDLFGSVSEPMYTMELHEEFIEDSMKTNSPVYYSLEDPRTRFITVECDDEGRFKVIQS